MLKKTITTTLIGLGLTQLQNPICANEDSTEFPCCAPTVVVAEPLDPCCINPLYPYPATISLCDGWDVYAKGEFIYYSSMADTYWNTVTDITFDDSEYDYFSQKAPYRPGFRISIGADVGDVVLDLTYLRYHPHTTTHFSTKNNAGLSLNYIAPTILAEAFGQPLVLFQNVKSSFHLALDYGILSLQKPIYMGKRIILNLNYGLLGLWTRQKWEMTCTALANPAALPPFTATSNGVSTANHKSWAVGPNLGFKAIGLLPWNLSGIFNLDISLMYGSCTKAVLMGNFPQAPFPIANNSIGQKDHSAHLEAFHSGEIGLGWGRYLCCERYHVDLTCTYNIAFQHIFNYGIPFLPTGLEGHTLTSYSFHGLAIGGRLDF